MEDWIEKHHALINLLRNLPSNVIAGDFADVSAMEVKGRDFRSGQQPDGAGLHVSFSINWHALGKMGEAGHDAVAALGTDQVPMP